MSKSTFRLTEAFVIVIACLAIVLLIAPAFIGESLATEPGTSTQPASQPASKAENPFTKLRRLRYDASNLRGIYQGVMGYAGENSDKYPAYARMIGKKSFITQAQGFRKELRESNLEGVESNTPATAGNVTAALWLLLREDHLPVKIFVNPNTKDTPDPVIDNQKDEVTITDLYDFAGPQHFSYSFMNFYHSSVRRMWSNSVGPTYVLAANDNNSDFKLDGPTDYRELSNNTAMNSKDHAGKGQNMVFGDGHAEFIKQPVSAFNKTDNVYTWWDKDDNNTDSASINSLAKKNWSRITSVEDKKNVLTKNHRKDVFLLPVDSLVKPVKKK